LALTHFAEYLVVVADEFEKRRFLEVAISRHWEVLFGDVGDVDWASHCRLGADLRLMLV
jgi:hypothetical protein